MQQVIPAHARFAGDAGGDHHNVGVYGVGIVIGPDYMHIALLDRQRFQQVETLALRHALHDIDQHDIRQFLGCYPVSRGCAHIPCSYDGYFLSHISPKALSRLPGSGESCYVQAFFDGTPA
jgi:hypothetical protein